jgi:hypothetical protein
MDQFKEKTLLILEKISSNDSSFKFITNELKKILKKVETKEINEIQEINFSLILLNFIEGNISTIGLNYTIFDKKIKDAIKKIVVQFSENPFCNINKELKILFEFQNESVLNLIKAFEISYKNGQINFIQKAYKKIKFDNLLNILGKNVVNNEFLEKNGWKLDSKFVVINDGKNKKNNISNNNNIDVIQAINDIKFIGETNIKLDKFIQGNLLIEPIEK